MKKFWMLLAIAAMFSLAACQTNTQKVQEAEPVEEEVIEEEILYEDTLQIEEEVIEGEEVPVN